RPQQRDGASDARLAVEISSPGAGRFVQGGAVLGEQCLVGGYHAGTTAQGREKQRPSGLDAADHLDDDVNVLTTYERHGVGGEQRRAHRQVSVTRRPSYGDAGQLDRCTDSLREVVPVRIEQAYDVAADDATAKQRDPQRRGHPSPSSKASRSSTVSRRISTRDSPAPTATSGGRGTLL